MYCLHTFQETARYDCKYSAHTSHISRVKTAGVVAKLYMHINDPLLYSTSFHYGSIFHVKLPIVTPPCTGCRKKQD